MSRAILTAVIVPGKITQRVDRVIRPHRDAIELLARADAIAAERQTERSAISKSYPNSSRPRPSRSASSPSRMVAVVTANSTANSSSPPSSSATSNAAR